jgi:hypothetical protein
VLNSFFDPEPRISKGCDRSGHTRDFFLLLKFLRPAGESQKLRDNPDGSVLFEADIACTKDFKG